MSNRKVFPNTFHMILEMSVLSEFEEFVCHTTKVVTPGFHRRQFCQKTVLRLAKLFPTSHAASGWFPRLRKSEPWVSTSPPPQPPIPPACPPERASCQKDKPRCIPRNILRNQSGKPYLTPILHIKSGCCQFEKFFIILEHFAWRNSLRELSQVLELGIQLLF